MKRIVAAARAAMDADLTEALELACSIVDDGGTPAQALRLAELVLELDDGITRYWVVPERWKDAAR